MSEDNVWTRLSCIDQRGNWCAWNDSNAQISEIGGKNEIYCEHFKIHSDCIKVEDLVTIPYLRRSQHIPQVQHRTRSPKKRKFESVQISGPVVYNDDKELETSSHFVVLLTSYLNLTPRSIQKLRNREIEGHNIDISSQLFRFPLAFIRASLR